MDYDEALKRINNHANLPDCEDPMPDADSFLFQLWNANRTGEALELESPCEDVIDCLIAANVELNGETPSETSGYQIESVIREFAYPVTSIMSRGWQYYLDWTEAEKFTAEYRNQLAEQLVRLNFTWEQVLAGDIDDLRSEYELYRM